MLLPPLDVQNKGGGTAAIEAAYYGHVDCLTALIENKANLDIQVQGSYVFVAVTCCWCYRPWPGV